MGTDGVKLYDAMMRYNSKALILPPSGGAGGTNGGAATGTALYSYTWNTGSKRFDDGECLKQDGSVKFPDLNPRCCGVFAPIAVCIQEQCGGVYEVGKGGGVGHGPSPL